MQDPDQLQDPDLTGQLRSGSHCEEIADMTRYVLLMYAQPTTFTAPANLSTAGTPLGTFFVQAYHDESGLGDLVAANYFQVENGVATATVRVLAL